MIEKKKGKSIILTTHHLDEADILGDRIAVIDRGHLQAQGTSAELKSQFSVGHKISISLGANSNRKSVFNIDSLACEAPAPRGRRKWSISL